MTQPNQPNPEILEHSQKLNYWDKQPDYTPFSPSNGNEEQWFWKNWCSKCQSIKYQQECSILIQMYAGGKQPNEIYFFENVPVCERFKLNVKTK